LGVYDNTLRKQTGSYYTPPEVVGAMVRLVNEELTGPRFSLSAGLASPSVTLVDPATGTGTFLLGVLRTIADSVAADQGPGAIGAAINDAINRLIAFEMQLGPFAVAQLRIVAEIVELTGGAPKTQPRMFVTNTLSNPDDDEGYLAGLFPAIGTSRVDANKIKRDEPITVVIGNPPYKEKAKGLGAWVEGQTKAAEKFAPLADWIPPKDWGVGAHTKHLRNLYIYFWRWATWKVFDHHPTHNSGIVCFITVAGFLNGPGFQKMRDYMRRTSAQIWVVDCSPEGHQPEVSTRVFQGVQQPVCIVLASRPADHSGGGVPAEVWFRALPKGHRDHKFAALGMLSLNDGSWIACPSDWRAPFLPASQGPWSSYPHLESLFVYNGSGVQPKRTWVIAPDTQSLNRRWEKLITSSKDEKELLFHPTLRDGEPADRHVGSIVREALPGYAVTLKPLFDEVLHCPTPVPYGFRSFNRQWIIPDLRVITQPNAQLWKSISTHQVYLTALSRTAPTGGPAITFTGLVPDLDHYKGSFGGRVFPLWRDGTATEHNFRPNLLPYLSGKYGRALSPDDLLAYIAAVAAHPGFTDRFRKDLSTPGLRIPLTADGDVFETAAELGRRVIWLHAFGERMTDPAKGRPAQPPRLPPASRPQIPANGAIPEESNAMPDEMSYEAPAKRLRIGKGFVENVSADVWNYEVSGKQVLVQWFSYRKANRDRPIIGDRRPPSPLGDIQPSHWLAEYTTELINLLNVLGLLVELEPDQSALLERVCSGSVISERDLRDAGALEMPATGKSRKAGTKTLGLFDAPH
jgi:hypothetical protein